MDTKDSHPSPSAQQFPQLSVVAPCYNEAESLAEFLRRTIQAVRSCVREEYEIVLVDDGSTDRTWSLMAEAAGSDERIRAFRLSRNLGHQRALTAGLFQCRGERVLVIDADLQDPPELLGDMMALMDRGADVVFGRRRARAGETWFKSVSAALFYRLLSRLSDVPIPLDTGDFRLMSRRMLDVFRSMPEDFRFIRGMVSWIGMTQVPILYDRDPRYAGETGYSLRRMLRLALDAIAGFSVLPLRLAAVTGACTGLGAFLLLFYALISWLMGVTVTGWTSLASLVLILGSAQLVVLAVFGEYLGRLYLETKRRPLFVIQDAIHPIPSDVDARRAAPQVSAATASVPSL